MGKIIRLAIMVVAMGFMSCANFLEVEPKASISDQQTIIDKASAETAINGVYEATRSYYEYDYQSIGYLSGDNIVWTGSHSTVQELINHQVYAENRILAAAWTSIYRALNRINHILDKVPTVNDVLLTEARKNHILGEAHFLRALSYFDLVRIWGGVPVLLEPTQSPTDNQGIPRSTVSEVYAQVLRDLEIAEPLLSTTIDRHRVTKQTVWALRARFHLYQKEWALAAEYASKVLSDEINYQLVKPYSAFFANGVTGTQESVFEFAYNTNETNSHRNQWQPQENGGTRQWAPNDELVALLNNPDTGGGRNALIGRDNQGRWFGNLYYRNPAIDPTYVIRTAELYLIRAEANAHLGNITAALTDLNAVRDRAELAHITHTSTDGLLLAIEQERRLEFALEPHRWYDLVRTNRAKEVLGIQEEFRLVLPIPASEILIDNALEQNEGY